jgi:hypothetical protein
MKTRKSLFSIAATATAFALFSAAFTGCKKDEKATYAETSKDGKVHLFAEEHDPGDAFGELPSCEEEEFFRVALGNFNEKDRLGFEISSLEEAIAFHRESIEKLEWDMRTTKRYVDTLKASVVRLEREREVKLALLEGRKPGNCLNPPTETAYFIAGSADELVEAGVMEREKNPLKRALLGNQLTDAPDSNLLFPIPKEEVRHIPVEADKATLLTEHPADSYDWELDADQHVKSLVVVDPAAFWEESNCLVILTK